MGTNHNPSKDVSTASSSAPLEQATSPKLSIIVPVHNGEMQVSRCLEGLLRSEYSNFEVIVVDDCSTDGTAAVLDRYPVRRVRTPHTMGPAAARNMGIGYAEGSIVVFVDADVVVPTNALGIIAGEFERNPQVAAMFGSYDEEPAWDDFCSQYKNLMHSYVHQRSNVRATTFWAGCGAVRKEIFVWFGGFDFARYRKPSIEDIELGYRLVRGGQQIRLVKELQVKHLKKWTLRNMVQTDIFCRAIPWTKLILETRNLPRDLNLTSGARLSAGLVGLISMGWVILLLQTVGILPALTVPRTLFAEFTVAAIIVAGLVALNWDVYSYFGRKRGWWFAVRVVPLHWFYYLYSGGVFVIYGSMELARRLAVSMLPVGRGSRATPSNSHGR